MKATPESHLPNPTTDRVRPEDLPTTLPRPTSMSDAAIDLEMLLEHTAESFETEEWCLGDLHERLGAYSAHDQVTHRMLASIIVEQLNPAVASQWLEIAYGTRRTVGELRREIAENLLSADMDPDYGHVHPGRAPTPAQATGIA